MNLEPLTWRTMPAPTDAKVWPCMVCKAALGTHRRVIRRGITTITMIVCLDCGSVSDSALLLALMENRNELPADMVKRLAE